jgi:spore maturation protein CgeB
VRLLIVGNRGGTNVGGCLEAAGAELGLDVRVLEARRAMEAPAPLRRVNWWLRGRRPTWLRWFGREAVATCRAWRPDGLIATGLAPLDAAALRALGGLGVPRVCYLTDDPWNPAHRGAWALRALPEYDAVLSPRRANLGDLARLGCRQVAYLPFAYAPHLHYPDPPASAAEAAALAADVVFAGGGEPERARLIGRLAAAGFRVALYGSLWERFPETRGLTRGQADPATVRRATSAARVALGLVRRANRDGHTMRSFEAPAIGACLLLEDTDEHREIFGTPGAAAVYFRDAGEMLDGLRWLLAHDAERARLAAAAHRLVTREGHAYRDRLAAMLAWVGPPAGAGTTRP